MFTVIAIDKNLEPLLKDFLPLYNSCMNNDTIKIITWYRDGKSLNECFPQLDKVIFLQNEWRMIIISDEMDGNQINPFDSYGYSHVENLIYSSQLLGYVPPHITFDDNQDILNIEDFDNLNDNFQEGITEPNQIYLLAVTKEKKDSHNYNDMDKNFWDRCNYPSNCRFIKYNLLEHSNIVTSLSKLELVLAIHTISYNEISSNDLQAYEVYNLSINLDKDKLYESFNKYYNRLWNIENKLHKNQENIQQLKNKNIEHGSIYDINVNINVEVQYENANDLYISKDDFGIFKDVPKLDRIEWNLQRERVNESLIHFLKQPRRSLKKATKQAQKYGEYNKDEVSHLYLNEFQMEDLQEELNNIELELVQCETNNIFDITNFKNEQEKIDINVKRIMKQRGRKKIVISSLLICSIIYFIGFIPFLVSALHEQQLLEGIFIVAIILGGFVLVGIIAILYNKNIFMKAINQFNKLMYSIIDEVQDIHNQYSQYLSYLSSFMKGKSLQYQLTHEKEVLNYDERMIFMHLKKTDRCMKMVTLWIKTINKEFQNLYEYDEMQNFDFFIQPEENQFYNFQDEYNKYPVQLNNSPNSFISPFEFIKSIGIQKGE